MASRTRHDNHTGNNRTRDVNPLLMRVRAGALPRKGGTLSINQIRGLRLTRPRAVSPVAPLARCEPLGALWRCPSIVLMVSTDATVSQVGVVQATGARTGGASGWRKTSPWLALVALSLLSFAAAQCNNLCSGHGECSSGSLTTCSCYRGWTGGDCSLRT